MHLKNSLLFGLMAILLLGGTITPALSQSSPDSNIVINEVELNPRGSDGTLKNVEGSQEYVELYNPTSQSIDFGVWLLVPTASCISFEIHFNTMLEP
jgi:hypothetical protein